MNRLTLVLGLLICSAAGAQATTRPASASTSKPATAPTTTTAPSAPVVEDLGTDATFITFSAKDIPLADALRQIGRKAHAPLGLYPPPNVDPNRMGMMGAPNPNVEVNVTNKPFWAVVLELTQPQGLRLSRGADMYLMFSRSAVSQVAGPSVSTGPCLLSIPRIARDDIVDYADAKNTQRRLQFNLECLVEPKLAPDTPAEVKITDLLDAAGNGLLLSEGVQQSDKSMTVKVITLRRPPDDGRIALVKGEARFKARPCPRWYIDDVLAAAGTMPLSVQVQGKARTLHLARKSGATLEIEISVDGKPITDAQPLLVHDRNGMRLQVMRTTATGDGHTLVTFARTGRLGVAAEPLTVVWPFPGEPKEFACPFEFKNLPVP